MPYQSQPGECKHPGYYLSADGEYRRRLCASRWCPDHDCRQAWARREAYVLLRSFATLPPTHFIVLTCRDFIGPDDCRACLRAFIIMLRRIATFEYRWWLEPAKNGHPHVHVLLRLDEGEIKKRVFRRFWRAACAGRRSSAYFEPVRTISGAAFYIPKFRRHALQIPDGWTRPLAGHSRGFYSKSKAELWREVKAGWFVPPRST